MVNVRLDSILERELSIREKKSMIMSMTKDFGVSWEEFRDYQALATPQMGILTAKIELEQVSAENQGPWIQRSRIEFGLGDLIDMNPDKLHNPLIEERAFDIGIVRDLTPPPCPPELNPAMPFIVPNLNVPAAQAQNGPMPQAQEPDVPMPQAQAPNGPMQHPPNAAERQDGREASKENMPTGHGKRQVAKKTAARKRPATPTVKEEVKQEVEDEPCCSTEVSQKHGRRGPKRACKKAAVIAICHAIEKEDVAEDADDENSG